MGTINVIAKWNIEENKWDYNVKKEDRGKAFSIADYEKIKNNESEEYNYLLVFTGSRNENFSNDTRTIKETKAGIKRIIDYFKNTKENYIIRLIMFDNDAPIKEEGKLIASYIDTICQTPRVKSMNLLGLSKGAIMCFDTPKYIKTKIGRQKTNIYTTATPFDGTIMASPKILFPQTRDIINSHVSNEFAQEQIFNALKALFDTISSNSHMDYDIAIKNGIPDEYMHLYDPSLIEQILSTENIEALKTINTYINFYTGIDNNTLKEAIKTVNFAGIGLCILDDTLFKGKSDGLVLTKSQRLVEAHFENLSSTKIPSSHHNVLSNQRTTIDLLSNIKQNIEENPPKQKIITPRRTFL